MTAAVPNHVDLAVPGGPVGSTWLRLFRPSLPGGPLPIVLYVHDGARSAADARIRRMATRLMTGLPLAVVAVDYSLSPGARYPVALQEAHAALEWAAAGSAGHGLDGRRIAVVADPGAAGLATRLVVTALDRGEGSLVAYVPVGPRMRASLRTALGLPSPARRRSAQRRSA
ncbi:alpha/beta hydrolase fold domain-containing protein [Dactylosporangium sp. NPDC051485]|uniref:alpha/beta hydrolase fold domain-containing protein n=1 Tax=Dactylosporangium sp. NPDC051485 TaxID=3154846 RepID=UPI003424DF5A